VACEIAEDWREITLETPPPATEVICETAEDWREITVEGFPTKEDTKLDARLKTDETADPIGLPVGTLTPPVRVSPGTVRVPPGSPTETPTPPVDLEAEGVGLIEMMTEGVVALTELGLMMEGSTTELKVGN
jgi:hypothetical protein